MNQTFTLKRDEEMNTRISKMAELIKREGHVSLSRLKEYFPDVSEMTLRRDLHKLEQNRLVVRVHGGAKSFDAVTRFSEDLYSTRSVENTDSKMLIAQKALKLLHPNESVFLDSGSTCTTISRNFPDDHFRIVTSGLTCAIELAHLSQSSVLILGGKVYSNSLCVNGAISALLINDMNFDIAFIGTTGYSKSKGFTVNVEEDYVLKKLVISKAKKVVIVMDASKVEKNASYVFARLSDIDVIVSDDKIDPETINEFKENGIEII
jgi:DeoR family transcriptional regulator, aga operon transcriptional repressor